MGTNYYTLGYAPRNTKKDGSYRRIQVKTSNGGHRLPYRRGYYAEDAKAERTDNHKADSNPLVPLMEFSMPDFSHVLHSRQR
jgi:hypothetical protein